jgi:hypothetical protein
LVQFPLDSGKKEKEDPNAASGSTPTGNAEGGGGGGSLLISNNVRILPRDQLQVIQLFKA